MRLSALLPHATGLRLEQALIESQAVIFVVAATARTSRCPLCSRRSSRIHSRYCRTLNELPLIGRRAWLQLRVRRFYCQNHRCRRRIFAERFPQLTIPYGRRTHASRSVLVQIGLALGGNAGVRLAQRLAMPATRSTLLRLVEQAPLPPTPTPRVLGVDEWAKRRGRGYGTILVDLERHEPVDLLPDRTAMTFAAWLRQHPGIEVICRDRSGSYADGARQGAPDAVQVADRWHLLANVGEAVERVLNRKRVQLREAAIAVDRVQAETDDQAVVVAPPPSPEEAHPKTPTKAQREQAEHRDRRKARYDAIVRLHQQGMSLQRIARETGVGRKTVRRFLRAGSFPERAKPPRRPTLLAEYDGYLRKRWMEGCHNAWQLWEEICEQGFTGSAPTVRRYVASWRAEPARHGLAARRGRSDEIPSPPLPQPTRVRSPRQARWLLLHPEERLRPDEQLYRAKLLEVDADIRLAKELADRFATLVRERRSQQLEPWLQAAEHSELEEFREFAVGIRRDHAAVEAALIYEWSSGQVEGQINRVKMLKRQLYGRASLPLLKKRVLLAS